MKNLRAFWKRAVVCFVVIVVFSVLCLITLLPTLWQKIVNPWTEHGQTFCSKRYEVCVTNSPKWSVKIPARDFPNRMGPIISFLALDFQPERVVPDIRAEVLIFLENLPLPSPRYEVSGPLDFLLLLQHQSQSLSRDFRVSEKPVQGTLNGCEMATMRGTAKMIGGEILDFKTFVFVVGHQGFTVTYRAGKKHFDLYLSQAMEIIASLTFRKGEKA